MIAWAPPSIIEEFSLYDDLLDSLCDLMDRMSLDEPFDITQDWVFLSISPRDSMGHDEEDLRMEVVD